MLDRGLNVYQIVLAARKRLFKFPGSLFDGELVWSQPADEELPRQGGPQLYLVFDAIRIAGEEGIGDLPFVSRLQKIRELFDTAGRRLDLPQDVVRSVQEGKIVAGGNHYGLSFVPKPCLPCTLGATLLRQLSGNPYRTDGLVFTRSASTVQTGRTDDVLKWKPPGSQTVDVLLDGRGAVKVGKPTPQDPEKLCNLREEMDSRGLAATALAVPSSECDGLAECLVSTTADTISLQFVRWRTDKQHPNSIRTFSNTVESLVEPISLEDLRRVMASGSEAAADVVTPLAP